MVSLQPSLTFLLNNLPPRPFDQQELNNLVRRTLAEAKLTSSPENRKAQWEYLLKADIFNLAATEGTALAEEDASYYEKLTEKLDLVLTFTEHDACEQTFPLSVLQDLLETQTVASCSHIFSWIELHAVRLTEGMVPQKGKALVLLRTLNDLLRRLSKMGSTTIFCGRILTFLSGVFPLGERSGVNLRGEYGPTWEGIVDFSGNRAKKGQEEKQASVEQAAKTESRDDKMQVDSSSKEEFYRTFWSLQLPFSKPPIFAQKDTFNEFRDGVNKVLPVIKEATAKERAMMGSRVGPSTPSSLKRKREPDVEEITGGDYFFAKFLTSPDLLDLEIADTHFRRQFLFQLLVLLNHLLTFTKATKSTWSTVRNRSLQMDFTLEPSDIQWVQETITKASEELRQTTPNGRAFADTVNVILEREKNWVKWKNELCAPFDKEPWSIEMQDKNVGLLEATADMRRKMMEPPDGWPWSLGSEPLTEIWEMGYQDLQDLQMPFRPGNVKDFVRKVKQEDARIAMRKKVLSKTAERIAQARAKAVATSTPVVLITSPDTNATSKPEESNTSLAGSSKTSEPVSSQLPFHPSLPARPSSAASGPIKPADAPVVPPSLAPGAAAATPTPVPAPPSDPWIGDDQLTKYEENKQRWSWLALRTARDQYLQLFGRVGTGDIELLAQEIEKEQEKEKPKGEEAVTSSTPAAAEEQGTVGGETTKGLEGSDVKMEDGR